MQEVVVGQDGLARCWWGSGPEYVEYHDAEWGRAVTDDSRLFEKLCLEGFQSGLSWLTILRKRPAFRSAFAGFDPILLAGFDESDVFRLLSNSGIVRHQGKIRSTINNANRALEVIEENGSLTAFFWSYADPSDQPQIEIPPTTETSTRLAKDLKKRGFTFVGPTTVYAFMQGMGLVNDHLADCHARQACAEERSKVLRSVGSSQ
jgi:DNA-3-methyladenine glycosylase I